MQGRRGMTHIMKLLCNYGGAETVAILESCPLKANALVQANWCAIERVGANSGCQLPRWSESDANVALATNKGRKGTEVAEGWWRGITTGSCVICSLTGEDYSSEQVGVSESLTAPFKMTKSILWYWSVILLSFSGHLTSLPPSLLSFSHLTGMPSIPRPLPDTPYWSSLVIGCAVIWDGHWRMSANCFPFILFLSSRVMKS